MKYLKQMAILLAVSFAGEVLHAALPLPVPASIYGIVLMLVLLMTHTVKVSQVKETAAWLVAIMPVMFVPAAIGLIGVWDIFSARLWQFLLIIFSSTVVVMACAGSVTQLIIRRGKREKEEKTDA